ncbi:MAG: glycosyltransferase, partial [Oscillatoriales cyanobacterium SM2_2_1]|nr:glycosyltransferase [Oscillatoriales cyanobacterium SM2_2_1]
PTPPYLLSVTRLIPRKNVHGLIAAYGRCAPDLPWDLVICGSGSELIPLQRQIAELNLQSRVYWPGFIAYDQMPRWYAHAAAFIHPALSEQWGLVVNEAAAAGVPILCSQTVGAAVEMLRDRHNALLFPPDNEMAIAQAILEIYRMPDAERQILVWSAQATVAQYGPKQFATGFINAASSSFSPYP